ncbi:nucleotide exchange factor GrpE [Mycoplasma mycoides]|uniref:Protein GrpE n=1 Tax=Mycoplasma mycoides subsp. capri TaxID=40477 RepID=A0AB38GE52_MYCMC|nr:nucleotide exchange factor GrpE [Mycoplasma mycoides]ADH21616.1 co-chaperone GrpE [synthetic Mycoplasma mycoides JCVI-syn1.0]AMW76564.1 grpE: Nucleotide exchange factor for DnaK [synthetic bacterium JCVI-Syn3.0]AMW77036.1 grpE: Nucleotide exchange factor for DnaK [synthetic bacterium JCVI-Syn2.0]AVX54855.1 Nucleotide exchange factor [synthetic bacterium JCVI-Syn3A]QWN46093.1 nucleotide exchange factor GrpE [synthetic bacterium JCVI-Syn3B]
MTEELKNKKNNKKYYSQNRNKTKAEFQKTHIKKNQYLNLKTKLNTVLLEVQNLKDLNETLKLKLESEKQLNLAEISNLTKKYNQKESETKKYGASNLAKDLIQPLEILKKVVNAPNNNEVVQAYVKGFEMIINQINNVLESHHIKAMNVKVGDMFNPHLHDANEAVESDMYQTNQIVGVLSDGYMIHDKVLVYAIVKVAK